MRSTGERRPLGVGLAGLGRSGAFHLERVGLRDDLRVAAVYDPDPERLRAAPRHGGREHTSRDEFLADDSVDLVLVSAPPGRGRRIVLEALDRGRHVAVEPPLGLTVRGTDRLLRAAARSGRLVTTIGRRCRDEDFQAALSLVRRGELGRIRSARWTLLAFHGAASRATMLRRGAEQFDQLRQLIDDVPRTVFATASDLSVPGPVTACVVFQGGAAGVVEIDLGSFASAEGGWILSGTRGAYQRFEFRSATAESEVFGVPVKAESAGVADDYEDLVKLIRRGDLPEWRLAGEAARRTVILLDAVRRSIRSGQSVAVEGW